MNRRLVAGVVVAAAATVGPYVVSQLPAGGSPSSSPAGVTWCGKPSCPPAPTLPATTATTTPTLFAGPTTTRPATTTTTTVPVSASDVTDAETVCRAFLAAYASHPSSTSTWLAAMQPYESPAPMESAWSVGQDQKQGLAPVSGSLGDALDLDDPANVPFGDPPGAVIHTETNPQLGAHYPEFFGQELVTFNVPGYTNSYVPSDGATGGGPVLCAASNTSAGWKVTDIPQQASGS